MIQDTSAYRDVFMKWLLQWPLTESESTLLESAKTSDGCYPVPGAIDPTRGLNVLRQPFPGEIDSE